MNYQTAQPNILQNAENFVSEITKQAIVRPFGSPNLTGMSGLLLDILEEEEIALDSDITDHYVQENYAVQDHISLKPLRFSLRGQVGELIDDIPNALASIFTQVTGLATLGGLAPQFNIQDTEFYAQINNVVQLGTNILKQVRNSYQLFNQSATTSTRQQTVYQYLVDMRNSRQFFTVETPFAVFDNMAIESLRVLQNGETNSISEFTVTFKQIKVVYTSIFRIGSLITQNFGSKSVIPLLGGGRFQAITASKTNLGSDQGTQNDQVGKTISVKNTSENIFTQQKQFSLNYVNP